ncbi:hypothetical protein [uncultured Thiodictyon sp.]|uniref:rhamnosyltransferase WsaF family glycosyltransferase n=1 Tax=uncultured Thiodictyon sp. TaxID=1846217 RepID=UPI0025EE897E|nr:hypothetical protein [uncultured Thiodictyon sp.]
MRSLRIAVGVWRRDPEYLARLGLLKLARRLPWRIAEESPSDAASAGELGDDAKADRSVRGLLFDALPDLAPLVTYPDPDPAATRRLTVLTDSLDAASQFGADATAILFAVALARHRGLRLRWVTRHRPPEPSTMGAVLAAHGVSYHDNIDFDYAPIGTVTRELGVADHELIATTSWQTTWAALQSFDPSRIIYLVQDDERVFYPAGEERLRCREILCDARIRFVVDSAVLLKHLVAEGMTGVAANGIAFEPAFVRTLYYREPRPPGGKRCFVLYAGPNHPHHLLLRGLEALAGALERGFFPATEWDVHIIGKAIPGIALPGGIAPTIAEALPWQDYAALMRRTDVALSLSCTPRPSYPSSEFVASGAVVVTNHHERRHSIDSECANILCVEPSVEHLVAALGRAAELAAGAPQRQANDLATRIDRDWAVAFALALGALAGY